MLFRSSLPQTRINRIRLFKPLLRLLRLAHVLVRRADIKQQRGIVGFVFQAFLPLFDGGREILFHSQHSAEVAARVDEARVVLNRFSVHLFGFIQLAAHEIDEAHVRQHFGIVGAVFDGYLVVFEGFVVLAEAEVDRAETLDHFLAQRLVDATLNRALTDKQVQPLSQPSIAPAELKPEAAFSYKARFEVRPDIEKVEWEGLEAKRPTVTASDDMIDAEIQRLRREHSTLQSPDPARPAERRLLGDEVVAIRELLADQDIDWLAVSATHTHEGPDTMGLWGETIGSGGFDDDYRAQLRMAIAQAASEAIAELRDRRELIARADAPLLGVCLGHQGLALEAGAVIGHAPEPVHGRIDMIWHDGSPLFHGVPSPLHVVRYHSLLVHEPLPARLRRTAWNADGLIMALQHADRPRWGLQFHPESVCTEHGALLLRNFRDLTRRLHRRGPSVSPRAAPASVPSPARPEARCRFAVRKLALWRDPEPVFLELFADRPTSFWLDSSLLADGLSRFSFLGASDGPLSKLLTYEVATRRLTSVQRGVRTQSTCTSLFDALREELKELECEVPELPFGFACGLVGYLGYELKAETGGQGTHRADTPDAALLLADGGPRRDRQGLAGRGSGQSAHRQGASRQDRRRTGYAGRWSRWWQAGSRASRRQRSEQAG